ncbi:ATP phosphoribosyltransferase regulatory subunit [Rhodobacteraceae bacterium]|nr:ATP phosphoribosyltransferase regulatory subunit [Paracoccaceae bacterium]
MTDKADIRTEAERLRSLFEARGAEVFETDILQPAGALLDLYGEDIRARAFVTHDPLQGEMMLRPDFTLPLVQRHMSAGGGEGRYAYSGEVFRRQEDDPDRASEYMQVGFELFNGATPPEADADVFSAIYDALAPLGLRAAMGDIGLLRAAVEGVVRNPARQAALLHHLWRPRRFRAVLNRFNNAQVRDFAEISGVKIGLRSHDEVEARLTALRLNQQEPPLESGAVAMIDTLLAVREKAPDALSQLRYLSVDLPAIAPAVDALAARFDAMAARGIDVDALDFEASYGRTTLEYYDGFVFGFFAESRPDLPPVATGGRYDALTRAVGGSVGVPAVGGVIRPGLVIELGGAP